MNRLNSGSAKSGPGDERELDAVGLVAPLQVQRRAAADRERPAVLHQEPISVVMSFPSTASNRSSARTPARSDRPPGITWEIVPSLWV